MESNQSDPINNNIEQINTNADILFNNISNNTNNTNTHFQHTTIINNKSGLSTRRNPDIHNNFES